MKTVKGRYAVTAAILALSLAAVGCTKPPKWKDDLDAALAKQAEVKQYAFTGETDLDIGLPAPASGANAATTTLVSLFSKSQISWNGLSSSEPQRLEADYKLTPGGSSASTSFTLPVILTEGKLYMSIPLLNKAGEYFSFEAAKPSASGSGAASALPVEGLSNVNKALSDSLRQLLQDFDAKWFKKDKEAEELPDGKSGTVLRMSITESNRDAITEKVKAKLPAVIDVWKTDGILTSAQADALKKGVTGTWKLTGGELAFTLDEEGFIRRETVKVAYQPADGTDRHVSYTQAFNGINQPPAFQKEAPKNVKPFEDVLKLLQSSSAK